MVSELLFMELASDQQKLQKHEQMLFPCSAYHTDWRRDGIRGVPWHWHSEFELMMVVEGSVESCFGSERVVLHTGDGFFVNSRSLHRIEMTDCDRCQVRSLVFDPLLVSGGRETVFHEETVQPLLLAGAFPGMALYRNGEAGRAILEHIRQAHQHCECERGGYVFDVRYHLSKALYRILQENACRIAEAGATEGGARRTQAMVDYVHRHFDEPIALADLARVSNLCVREVQRCFRREMDITPIEYIQRYRIRMACKRLLDGNPSSTEVGLSCGFSNSSHFCRIFRQYMGCSPTEFRRCNA